MVSGHKCPYSLRKDKLNMDQLIETVEVNAHGWMRLETAKSFPLDKLDRKEDKVSVWLSHKTTRG
jgi:hypothetical protein